MIYGIKKTPLLKRERGFLLGGKRDCSVTGIFAKARYKTRGIVRIFQNRIYSVSRISPLLFHVIQFVNCNLLTDAGK